MQNQNHYNTSFKMKKSELGVVNRFVFENCFPEKQKPDIQQFKVIDEFYDACKNFLEKLLPVDFDFGGRQEETKVQRKAMLKDWVNYVTKENGAYTPAMQLMILKSITKDLKPDEDTLPPTLNKGVLADTVTKVQEELNKDEKAQFNFDKEYRLNLQRGIFRGVNTLDENLNGWIIIPSQKHDEKNFSANVEKLKALSHKNWCTKSFNAEPYLSEGDFHVYMENGQPKLGVRFVGDEIQEIQGEKNNSRIPLKYGDITKEHIKKCKLTYKAQNELEKLEDTKAEIERILPNIFTKIKNGSTQEILEELGIKCKKDTDGRLIISHYKAKYNDKYSYSDLGINENKLFKEIKAIEGDADFKYSQITSLGNLLTIGGHAIFEDSQITNLGNLLTIGGDAYFSFSQVTDLGKLQTIGGNADFENSQVTNFGNLQTIGGYANFYNSQITDLGNLQTIGGNAYFRESKITSLGKLQTIGGWAIFIYSQITNLGNLQTMGGLADFENSQVTDLGNLQSIGGNANFYNSQITDLGNLQSIGEDVYIYDSKLKREDFDSVKVGGRII